MDTKILDTKDKKRLATRERVRKWRAKQKSGITVTTFNDGFTVEAVRSDASITLAPAVGINPLNLRLLYIGGRWMKILT